MRNSLAVFGVVAATAGCAIFYREEVRVPPPPSEALEPASMLEPEKLDLTDTDIRLAVRRELDRDPAVQAPEVDIAVEKGIVSLTGTVTNGLASLQAVESAETVRGVRGVVNRLRVAGPRVRDEELARMIRSQLSRDPVVEFDTLEIAVEKGRVRLSGKVDSFTEKQTAERLAWSVAGVSSVENAIRVVPAASRNDAEIAADIERRLKIDAHLDDERLRVAVHDGSVALVGEVGSALEKRRAHVNAWVGGVLAVDTSRVIVNPERHDRYQRREEPYRTNEEIWAAVRDALKFDPRVWSFPISIRVEAGIVTLSGVVPNWAARRAAERDALNTIGVWRIENELSVSADAALGEQDLERLIQEKLALYPTTAREAVGVRVESGVAVLHGKVSSRYKAIELEQAVEAVPGVGQVRNDLTVLEPLAGLRDDAMLERRIETELWWDHRVNPSNIEVEVRNGIAILTGIVRSRVEYDAVIENVLQGDPRGIENHLRRPLAPAPR